MSLSSIFESYKSLADWQQELPPSVAIVWKSHFKLRTLLDILSGEGHAVAIFNSTDAWSVIKQLCARLKADGIVVIIRGRVRFIQEPQDESDMHAYLHKPDFFPEHLSEPAVILIRVDLMDGKEPFKQVAVYKNVGQGFVFGKLIDAPLQAEDEKMIAAVKGELYRAEK